MTTGRINQIASGVRNVAVVVEGGSPRRDRRRSFFPSSFYRLSFLSVRRPCCSSSPRGKKEKRGRPPFDRRPPRLPQKEGGKGLSDISDRRRNCTGRNRENLNVQSLLSGPPRVSLERAAWYRLAENSEERARPSRHMVSDSVAPLAVFSPSTATFTSGRISMLVPRPADVLLMRPFLLREGAVFSFRRFPSPLLPERTPSQQCSVISCTLPLREKRDAPLRAALPQQCRVSSCTLPLRGEGGAPR